MAIYKSKRKYYKYVTERNATIVGSATVDGNFIASNFSSSGNYIKTIPETFPSSASSFEMVICFKSSNISSTVDIAGSNSSANTNNVPEFRLSGSKLSIYQDGIAVNLTGSTTLLSNTWYWARLSFNGSEYKLEISTDGITYTTEATKSSTSKTTGGVPFTLGLGCGDSSALPFNNGSIDLSQSYIKINGQDWWKGTKEVPYETTEADHDYSLVESDKIKDVYSRKQNTNCLLNIPQDIKLELTDGTLTLKAGSKVYVPNGFEADGVTPKFDVVVVESDFSRSTTTFDGKMMVFYYTEGRLSGRNISTTVETGSGTTPPSNDNYTFYNTSENKIYVKNSNILESYTAGLPIGIVTTSGGTITSIDQVFNGFGYIGSTVFALPNVKGLIPDGKNEDGSLRNIEFTTSQVRINNPYNDSVKYCGINKNGAPFFTDSYHYDNSTNTNIQNNTKWEVCIISGMNVSGGKIASFTPKSVEGYTKKARIVAAYKTGNRKYYKYVLQDWTQPVLTSNGTVGGKSFAVRASNTDSRTQPYYAFDSNKANNYSAGWLSKASNNYLEWYNPEGLNISQLKIQYQTEPLDSVGYVSSWEIKVSNNGTDYISLLTGTKGNYGITTIPIEHSGVYKYWRFYVRGWSSEWYDIIDLQITAKKQIVVESTSSDYDYSVVPNQLVYNLKYNLNSSSAYAKEGTVSGSNMFGADRGLAGVESLNQTSVFTFNTPAPSGKYTGQFTYYSQVNFTMSQVYWRLTYEDGTTEYAYGPTGLGDTAYGGGEQATISLSFTAKKPIKAVTVYATGAGGGSGRYGGLGSIQMFFDGSKQ